MNAQQRIDDALQVALDVLFAAQDAGEITVGDAAQIVDIVGAALRTVRAWAPEWETSNG